MTCRVGEGQLLRSDLSLEDVPPTSSRFRGNHLPHRGCCRRAKGQSTWTEMSVEVRRGASSALDGCRCRCDLVDLLREKRCVVADLMHPLAVPAKGVDGLHPAPRRRGFCVVLLVGFALAFEEHKPSARSLTMKSGRYLCVIPKCMYGISR